MSAAVSGDMEAAMPLIMIPTHASTYQYEVLRPRPRNIIRPVATRSRPTPTVRCAPYLATSRGVMGATRIMIGVMGRNRTAEPSGV